MQEHRSRTERTTSCEVNETLCTLDYCYGELEIATK